MVQFSMRKRAKIELKRESGAVFKAVLSPAGPSAPGGPEPLSGTFIYIYIYIYLSLSLYIYIIF